MSETAPQLPPLDPEALNAADGDADRQEMLRRMSLAQGADKRKITRPLSWPFPPIKAVK